MQKAAGQIAVPSLIISVVKKTCWQSAVLMWMIFTSQSLPAEVRNAAETACNRCSVWHYRAGNSNLTFHSYLPLITLMLLAFLRKKILQKITSYEWLPIFFAVCLYFFGDGVYLFFFPVAAANLCAFPFWWLPPLYSNRLSSTHSNADWRWRAKNPKAEIPGPGWRHRNLNETQRRLCRKRPLQHWLRGSEWRVSRHAVTWRFP